MNFGRKAASWRKKLPGAASTGFQPPGSRSLLPNSLKTEIAVTYNIREWRHFFQLRCSPAAHPQIGQVAIPLLLLFKENSECSLSR